MPSDFAGLMRALLMPAGDVARQARWQPPVDIYRFENGWLVKFDLAGVRPQDLEVAVSKTNLIIRGRRRDWVVEKHVACRAYSMEITYSEFQRTIELPANLERMRIETDYSDGMLLVHLSTEESTA